MDSVSSQGVMQINHAFTSPPARCTHFYRPPSTARPRRLNPAQPLHLTNRRHQRRTLWVKSTDEDTATAPTQSEQANEAPPSQPDEPSPQQVDEAPQEIQLDDSYVQVLRAQDLPKGERRDVVVDGKEILVFWYRNKVWACESRSPTEGAYSIGFNGARFTEDYGVVCPETGTVFSIQTGEVLDWYPNNVVLKTLIPSDTCRKLEVYPVEISGDGIFVSFSQGSQGGVLTSMNKGGALSSAEGNNVFFQEPTVYLEGTQPGVPSSGSSKEEAAKLNPITVLVGTVGVAILSVAGTAVAIYDESIPQLIGFWVVMLAAVGTVVFRFINTSDEVED